MEEQVGKTMLQDALRVLEMEVMDLVAVKKDIEFCGDEVSECESTERRYQADLQE